MTDPMLPNETLQSQLSAFVDDELPAAETELFTRRLVKESELKQAMARYGLIGEALRAPTNRAHVSKDFSARVAAALEQQEAATAAVSATSGRLLAARWLKPAAGLAVAASVAWVAVMTVRAPAITETPAVAAAEPLQPVTLTAQRSAPDSYVVPVAANTPSVAIPAARLTNYVVAHSEFSSPLGRHNMMTGLLTEGETTEEAVTIEPTAETTGP